MKLPGCGSGFVMCDENGAVNNFALFSLVQNIGRSFPLLDLICSATKVDDTSFNIRQTVEMRHL
jgi:hypothetical protein